MSIENKEEILDNLDNLDDLDEAEIKKSHWFNPTDSRSPEKQKAAYLNHLAGKKKIDARAARAAEKSKTTNEDVDALFSGENLTEEFKTQAKAIFEAAVLAKVEEAKAELEEQVQQQVEEQAQAFTESLVTKVDEYLEYVVSEWMEENKVAVESGLKAQIAEDFMVGLKNLFTENYIDIPEDKVEVVEGMAEKVIELEYEVDKLVSEQRELAEELNFYKKEMIIAELAEGLSEVQAAKLKSLAENIEFVSEEDYSHKVSLTKKKYFETKDAEDTAAPQSTSLDSEESLDESYSPSMSRYMQSISRIVKK